MITDHEIYLARHCISHALSCGASAIRVSLSKSVSDCNTLLNGVPDKVTHSADRSIYIYMYAEGRYGTFSTNRLEEKELEDFIEKAIAMVRMLGEDAARSLPSPERTATDAVTGKELGLFDEAYLRSGAEERLEKSRRLSIYDRIRNGGEGYSVISEECEYSESCDDSYLIDSQGFEGRHTETCFGTFTEITIEDSHGSKYSGYWWDTTPESAGLDIERCGEMALERAVSQIGPQKRRSGRYRMVVDRTAASRLVSPIFAALNASAIQQKMSFLEDSLGKEVFSDGLTIMDMARTPGCSGSRLFDTEGVATKDAPVIEDGVVRQYFVSTYMANKMGIDPTVEDITRPCILPYIKGEGRIEGNEAGLDKILKLCGNGIYVTGFNGGNTNPVTGDFSFGVEGFAFSKGKITHPVREMLITGNLTDLWNNLLAAGTDPRKSSRWQIPTLAFENVSFSA